MKASDSANFSIFFILFCIPRFFSRIVNITGIMYSVVPIESLENSLVDCYKVFATVPATAKRYEVCIPNLVVGGFPKCKITYKKCMILSFLSFSVKVYIIFNFM